MFREYKAICFASRRFRLSPPLVLHSLHLSVPSMADQSQDEKSVTATNHSRPVTELDESRGIIVVQNNVPSSSDDEGKRPVAGLKTTQDGKTILIPQPSDDPNDPLNWTWLKKNTVFLALLPGCFFTDWVITYGTTMVSTHNPC
jgi:hypothetical protein